MLDFLADTITYGLSLVLIGGTLRTRASAALLKGFSLSAMGALGVRFDCLPDAVSLPKAEVMGMISVLALAANLTPVLRLTLPWTGHHCWLRSILENLIEIRTAWRSGHGRVPQCRC